MKNILITGASKGIGQAIAENLADNDVTIYLSGRNKNGLVDTAQKISAKGAVPKIIEADLSLPNEVIRLSKEIDTESLDILVNNAGIAIVGPLDEQTLEGWQRTFDVNVTAPFLLIKQLHNKMPAGSSIINIASVASKEGFQNWSSYCMSKFALDGFAKSVREELRPKGIRVINLYPGAVATDIWESVPGEHDLTKMMKPQAIADLVSSAVSQPFGTVVEDITMRNLIDN